MNSCKVDNCTEIFYDFGDNSVYFIRSYSYDLNFLYKVTFPTFKLVREGTYAYCYDFIATLKDKELKIVNG